MKKKIIIIVAVICTLFVSGCSCVNSNGVVNSDTAEQSDVIQSDFTKIDGYDHLYYHKDTKVVYWIGGSYNMNVIGDDFTTSYMTAYYAPNGMPYLYDEQMHVLVEVGVQLH